MPVPRGGRLPGRLPPPVPPEAMEKLLDGLADALPDIPVGEINRALNSLFLELFGRGRLPAGETDGDGEEDAEKQWLPARPGDATAANPRAPEPPQPPDPTSALPTPEARRKKKTKAPLIAPPEEEERARRIGLDIIRKLRPNLPAFDQAAAVNLRQAAVDAFQQTRAKKIELQLDAVGPNPTRENAIKAFVDAHRNGQLLPDPTANEAQINLGLVPEDNAARVLRDSGINIGGLRRTVDTAQVTHAFSRHGPGNESDADQTPISPEAMSVYLDVVENYDSIKVRRKRRGTISLEYTKKINGVVFVVEEARRATLSFFDMWIKKN